MTIGQFLLIDSTLKYNGLVLYARAHSEDLGCYARSAKPWTSKWFKPLRGEVVVDCGSSVGFFTLLGLANGASVYAFEANPGTFNVLKRNIDINGFEKAAHLYNVALSDTDGTVTLYVPNDFTGSASLRRDWTKCYPRGDAIAALQIPATSLDHALADLKTIDWLLIDVEGVEDALLRGALNLIKRTKRVIIEISHEKSTGVREQLIQHGFSESSRGTPEEKVQYLFFTRVGASKSDSEDVGRMLNSQTSRSEAKSQ